MEVKMNGESTIEAHKGGLYREVAFLQGDHYSHCIGQNGALSDQLTSRPEGCSHPRELQFADIHTQWYYYMH